MSFFSLFLNDEWGIRCCEEWRVIMMLWFVKMGKDISTWWEGEIGERGRRWKYHGRTSFLRDSQFSTFALENGSRIIMWWCWWLLVGNFMNMVIRGEWQEIKKGYLGQLLTLCQNLTFMTRTNMTNDHFLVI